MEAKKTPTTLVKELSKKFSYTVVAETLNKKGYVTDSGKPWKSHTVQYRVNRKAKSRMKRSDNQVSAMNKLHLKNQIIFNKEDVVNIATSDLESKLKSKILKAMLD